MSGVPGRVDDAPRGGQLFARDESGSGHGQRRPVSGGHRFAERGGGGLPELLRRDQVLGGALAAEHFQLRVIAAQTAGRAAVVEVDVGEQQQVGRGFQVVQRFFETRVGTGHAAVDQRGFAGSAQQPGAEELLEAGPAVQRQADQVERLAAGGGDGADVVCPGHGENLLV